MTDRKKSVILVFDNLDLSGVEKAAISLLRASSHWSDLDLTGVICMDDRIGNDMTQSRLRHLTPGFANGGSFIYRLGRAFVAIARLRALARSAKILVAITPPAAILAWLAVMGMRCKVIAWVHYDLDGYGRERLRSSRKFRDLIQRMLYTVFVPALSSIIFVSHAARNSFVRHHPRRSGRNWIVLPNVLDINSITLDSTSRTLLKAELLKQQGKPLLLFLGRITAQKRWRDAIKVAEHLKYRNFSYNMLFVGDGLDRDIFTKEIRCSSASENIHYFGPDANPMPTLRASSALIITSLFEAWPNVILEAFFEGVPVISYDCPSGPREMLSEGRGILTKENPEEFCSELIAWFETSESEKAVQIERAKTFATLFLPENAAGVWETTLACIA